MANCSNNVGSRLDGGTAVADISEEPEGIGILKQFQIS